jgi:hypothetical protein
MFIYVDKTGSVAALKNGLENILQNESVKSLLILAADENGFTPETVDPILSGLSVPVMGGIFPQIIYGKENLSKGTIVAGLPTTSNIQFIPDIKELSIDFEEIIDEKFPEISPDQQTMFLFVDGLSIRIEDLLDSLFNVFGLDINYVGGGAGKLDFTPSYCLFTNDGLKKDGAVLAMTDLKSGIGVGHGWETIRGPFKVTESHLNEIRTLDWRPAFDVYREVVEEVSGEKFTKDNFLEMSKGYPFGINKVGSEKIVRYPFSEGENGAVVIVGTAPQESFVDILTGNNDSLVAAAGKAFNEGKEAFSGSTINQWTFFIDCVSRVLFMEDEFIRELDAVSEDNVPLIGALTLGEIANSGDDYLEFYNKTAVIAVIE